MDTNGWNDIGYNFIIRPNGGTFQGRGMNVLGAHASGHNEANIGVLVVGTYTDKRPTDGALESLQWVYNHICDTFGRRLDVRTHQDVNNTACPGSHLHAWVHNNLGSGTGTPPPDDSRPAPGPNLAFPLPTGHYFGPADGPNTSVSGHYGRQFNGRADTEWLQEWGTQLQRRGWNARQGGSYLTQHGNDGKYGPEYRTLALAFQGDQNIAVDGWIGPQTWNAAFQNRVT